LSGEGIEEPIMNRDPRTIGNHLHVAALLSFDRQKKVDKQTCRRFLRHFLGNTTRTQ
jgi:hypothetical protein